MTLQHKTKNLGLIAFTVMLPTLIEIIDTSIVNVSLDHIRGSLSAGYDEATWTITAYLVSNAIVIPMASWLARLIGRKNYQIASIALFTFSSFMCGSAWSLNSLVFFRILQGMGGGGLVPISQSILLESFPREKHGQAMAIFGLGAMLGPIVGPLLGGWITDTMSWRWIFYINIPIGIIAIIMNMIVIQDPPYMKRQRMKIDYWGLLFLSVGLGSLQFMLDKGENDDWFGSSLIVALGIISVVSLILLIINEYYSKIARSPVGRR
jgi:DHA2 family multidrug resistance protein